MFKLKIKNKEARDIPEYLGKIFIGSGGMDIREKYKIVSYNPETKTYLRSEKGIVGTCQRYRYKKEDIERLVEGKNWRFIN